MALFVAFGRDINRGGTCSVELTGVYLRREREMRYPSLKRVASIEEAAEARQLTGDLVFDADTMKIVQDERWLFPFEMANADGYARRKMKEGVKLVLK